MVDENLEPLRDSGVGEIVFSGVMSEGYAEDPERTAAAFLKTEAWGKVSRTPIEPSEMEWSRKAEALCRVLVHLSSV